MSPAAETSLPEDVRAALLAEIRSYLPAFLRRGASEQHDPVGDVKELLRLEEGDLGRIVSVHGCLDPAVVAFGEKLAEGIRRPLTTSTRPAEVGQAVRGSVDWPATVARRTLQGGDKSHFVVRSARKAFDVPENRALVWLLDQVRVSARRAEAGSASPELATPDAVVHSWNERIARLKAQVDLARRTEWLQDIEPQAPTRSVIRRLRSARIGFYRDHVATAAMLMLSLKDPSDELLVDLLSQRYFEPAQDWVIFEVCVALRLARAFAESSGCPRKTRLMTETGGAPYARYDFADGAEVSLVLQTWPAEAGDSTLTDATKRHGMGSAPSRPDLFILRSDPDPDFAVLELKATYQRRYLKQGLVKLLSYLGERPSAWRRQPSGWLVAPESEAFEAAAPGEGPLWLVSSDQVADAAVKRFAPPAAD